MTKPQKVKVDYEVGYGKPPKGTQFKPGQSGNRRGRPRGSQNISTIIDKELNCVVTITENGRQKKLRKKELIAKQFVNKAAGGDQKSTIFLINEQRAREVQAQDRQLEVSVEHDPANHLTLEGIKERLRQSDAVREAKERAEREVVSAVTDTPDAKASADDQSVLKGDGA